MPLRTGRTQVALQLDAMGRRTLGRKVVRVTGAHGLHRSGASIVHEQLVDRLAAPLGDEYLIEEQRGDGSMRARLLSRSSSAFATLLTSTPLPLRRPAGHLLPIVYDIRWRWTRDTLSRAYRQLDLWRTARSAVQIFTISYTVADQLRAMRVPMGCEPVVLELGPGQAEKYEIGGLLENTRTIALIGRLPHKRNEYAASALIQSSYVRSRYRVIAISVSAETARILRTGLPESSVAVVDRPAEADMVELLRKSSVYLALGTSEGFGLPYLEAAYFGCDVLTVRQTIALEVLGHHANYLPVAPTVKAIEAGLEAWDEHRVGVLQARAASRSWSTTARQVADVIGNLN